MDILTLGKMNQMAKDVDTTLEYLANTTFETLRDVCVVQADICSAQAGSVQCLEDTTQAGVDSLVAAGGGSKPPEEMMLWNTCHWGVDNGGCCLNWTVPDGTKAIKFEAQAGGGSGGPSQCCMIGQGGGTGAYTSKMIFEDQGHFNSTPGSNSSYSLCSGGTTQCSCCTCCTSLNACGRRGYTSYATGPGLSNFCAEGGNPGYNRCSTWCYSCFFPSQCDYGCSTRPAKWYGGDYGFCGVSGTLHESQYCWNDKYSQVGIANGGPFNVSSATGRDGCRTGHGCCNHPSIFPGGGGGTPFGHASCCWGGWGASGLLKVTYWK